jgi:hypothetical protein
MFDAATDHKPAPTNRIRSTRQVSFAALSSERPSVDGPASCRRVGPIRGSSELKLAGSRRGTMLLGSSRGDRGRPNAFKLVHGRGVEPLCLSAVEPKSAGFGDGRGISRGYGSARRRWRTFGRSAAAFCRRVMRRRRRGARQGSRGCDLGGTMGCRSAAREGARSAPVGM